MEDTKTPFFKRIKKAIVDFENYSNFAVEKLSIGIKYFAKLMLIFAFLISIAFSYKFSTIINNEEQLQIMYNQLADNGLDLKVIDEAINYVKSNNNFEFYLMLALSITIYTFFIYFSLGIADILLISILGIIISRITRIKLKYKPIFIMSIYALTLPIILNCIYIIVNTLTGFTIDYFGIVYNVIAYIYIITAILIIKTDFIEQQRELIKIVQEQERIKKEQEQENERPNTNPEDKDKDKDKNEKEPEEQPQINPDSEPEA